MQNSKLRVTELDFDTIKSNLVSFMKSQSEFTDYDFTGSGLNVLMDMLAYNTHYMAYYVNMVANEMFLDSASRRSSAVSIAKHLGYVPKSVSSASATVSLSIVATESTNSNWPSSISVPKNTKFTTKVDDVSYDFYTTTAYTATSYVDNTSNDTRTFTLPNVVLKEGKLGTMSYTVNQTGLEEKYVIPDPTVDTSTLVVKVLTNATDTIYDIYTLYDNVADLKSTSKVYFLQEVEDGKFEVYFGDGALGAKLEEGYIVEMEYMSSKGASANGAGGNDATDARSFTMASTLSYSNSSSNPTVVTSVTNPATGGTGAETLESIKYNAPKSFKAQDRAVTTEDYKTIVLNKYTNASSVVTWGGEDNDPIDYGSVYIAVRPITGLTLTDVSKKDLLDILKKYKVMSIQPKIVDPDYTFVIVNTTAYYDTTLSINPKEALSDNIKSTISSYNNTYINSFDSAFRHSVLVGLIDDTDEAIKSNVTKIKLKKRIKPPLKKSFGYILKYSTSLLKGTVTSDKFTVCTDLGYDYTVSLKDDSLGNLDLVDSSGSSSDGQKIISNVGTIDYTTGKVVINSMSIRTIVSGLDYVYITVDVDEDDVHVVKGQVVTIQDADISVSMVEDVT
tara:strand:+ start:5316 stop:7169 length:1854 start_codon:yes stop_codon:yes gene_type:complete